MKRISLFIGMIALGIVLQAQSPTLSALEYYFNTDPGVGNGTAVDFDNVDDANVDFTVDISALDPGFHFLFVRVVDADGTYGLIQKRKFYIQPEATPIATSTNIAAAEYFFNTDPGQSLGTELNITTTGPEIDEIFTIDLTSSGLAEGFHRIFIRTQDVDGRWSLAHGRKFYIIETADVIEPSANITGIEYFFDVDPGIGNGDPISFTSSGANVNETLSIPVGDLEPGFHQLHIRVQDEDGNWGIAQKRKFYVFTPGPALPTSAPIQKIEYFFGTDPGVGNGILVAESLNANEVDENFIVDLDGREAGTDTLYVRVIDTNGIASLSAFAIFEIIGNAAPVVQSETFTIAENALNGSVVGTVTASDVDEDEFTFSFLVDNETFAIDANSGEITVLDSTELDFETNASFSFTILATDVFDLVGEGVITINLTDVNEAPEMADITLSIPENSLTEALVTTLEAADPESDVLVFSILSGNDEGAFALNAETGALTILDGSLLDFETTPTFVLVVEVSDGVLSDEATVTINLEDVFENFPPTVANPISDKTLSDGFGTSTVNLTNVFNDADGHTLTYSAVSDDEDVVTVGVTGVTLTISEVAAGTANITVTADDDNGGTVEDVFVVTVTSPLSVGPGQNLMVIYPNPAGNSMSLAIRESEFVDMTIYSLDGKVARRFNAYHAQFDLSELNNGVYSVLINSTNRTIYHKLVVLK